MASLFFRLQRFARSPGRDPREDRLTEALAATLDAAPDAAAFLVHEFFGDTPRAPLEVNTQVYSPQAGRVDLELRFGRAAHPELRVWFENKVDAEPYGDQGRRYVAELERRGGEWRFSWLLRVDQEVSGSRPAGAHVHTWQDLAVSLKSWLAASSDDRRTERGAWFVCQFLDHLEREEKLAIIDPLDESDALALNRCSLADDRLRQLLDQTKALLERAWGHLDPAPEADNWPSKGGLRDFHLLLTRDGKGGRSPWPATCYFEWHGRGDHARSAPEGKWVIGSGVTFPAEDAPAPTDYPELFDLLEALGFEYGHGVGASRDYVYIFRYLSLDELAGQLASASLGDQARSLADWVIERFETLNALEVPDSFGIPEASEELPE